MSCKHHGEPGFVGGADYIRVPHRSAGLYHRRGAGLRRRDQSVGKGEEGIEFS
jgi:hypothetical protein